MFVGAPMGAIQVTRFARMRAPIIGLQPMRPMCRKSLSAPPRDHRHAAA